MKRGQSMSYFIGAFLSIIIISIFIFGWIRASNVNCDPGMIDVFGEFIDEYQTCINGNSCSFDYTEFRGGYGVEITPTRDGVVARLICSGRESNNKQVFEGVGMCFYNSDGDSFVKKKGESMDISFSSENWEYKCNGLMSMIKIEGDICFIENKKNCLDIFKGLELELRIR